MSELRTRLEITKLAHTLGAAEDQLSFLEPLTPDAVRTVRRAYESALFGRQEAQLKRLASFSTLLPAAATAKIAQAAMGPLMCGRVASAMRPADAAKLASHFSTAFLADVSPYVDPSRSEPIISALPATAIVEAGRHLLARQNYVTLARFVEIVSAPVAVDVVAPATGADILEIALYVDDAAALAPVASAVPDATIDDVIRAAGENPDGFEALVSGLEDAQVERLEAHISALALPNTADLTAAIADARA